jgi:RHS repeat-associated protein
MCGYLHPAKLGKTNKKRPDPFWPRAWRDFAGDTGKAVTTWNYDRFRGWLLTKRDAANTGPTYAYWPSGRLKQRTWARQAAGQPLTTAYSYNAAGDLVLTDYSDATPDVSLSYDRLGRSVATTDASGIRTFGYHLAGAVQSETYGNSGPLAGQSVSRTFDGLYRLGSLSSTGLPASVAYAYDSASRLREISQASHAATYAYTPNTVDIASITLSANGVTRLTSTKNYDQRGRLASVSHTIGSTALGHSYGYNSADQSTRATREDGSYWDYAYDTLGQINNAVKRRSDGVARLGQTFAYTYDDIGNRRSATLNNQTATYTADVLNRYVTRTVPSVVPVLGRAAADATVLVNRELTTRQDGWFYTEVAAANTTAPQYVKLDVSGIKPPAGTGPEIAAFEQRSAFLAQTPETFAYDSDGNLTQDGRWTYAWDAENRLIAMEARSEVATLSPALRLRLEFAYDGSGRRIRKQVKTRNDSTWTTTSDRRFLYDGWNLIAEFDANATNSTLALVRSYTWGLDLSGSMQGAGGVGGLLWTTFASPATTHAFLADGNGNVIASVDAATGLVSHADDYSPFGETIPLSGSRPGAFGFSSKYTDVETGLLYYGFRYYNPSTGRWLSRDPIEEAGGVNLYGFVSNNPTNDVDPLGLVGGGSGNQPPTPKEIEGARTRAFQLIKYFGNVGEGLPQKLLRRWLWKEGDYKLSDAEFNSVWGEKNYRVNAAFDNASVYKKINTLSMSEDFMRDLASKSEGQTFSGTYLIPDYAFGRTLGHFFWFVKVEAKRGCDKFTYEAKGTVHIEDNYDFNSMDRANRNDEGDVQKMRWFHNITGMGKDFKISSTRYPVSEKAPNSSSPYEAGYLKRQ